MAPGLVALLVFSAVLHVSWNVILKSSADPLEASSRMVAVAGLASTPLALAAWLLLDRPGLSAQGWALAGLSSIVELGYFVLLSAAYQRGDLSTVYPLARGTAAFGAAVAGVVILGEQLTTLALAGVACLLLGGWLVRRPVASGAAVRFAILCGGTIVTYSLIDRVGSREGPSWLYGWAVWAGMALLLGGWVLVRRQLAARSTVRAATSRGWLADPRAAGRGWAASPSWAAGAGSRGWAAGAASPSWAADWARPAAAGLVMLTAYLIVLAAYSVAPLALVAPVRESAVVLATAWGVIGLREREGAASRLTGALAIAVGASLIALG